MFDWLRKYIRNRRCKKGKHKTITIINVCLSKIKAYYMSGLNEEYYPEPTFHSYCVNCKTNRYINYNLVPEALKNIVKDLRNGNNMMILLKNMNLGFPYG